MAVSNLRILFRNLINSDQGCTLTDSPTCVATLPVTNLQADTARGKTARSSSLLTQDFKATWSGGNQVANMSALTRHNLTVGDSMESLIYAGAAWTNNQYDSTALAAMSTSGTDTTYDTLTAADMAGYRNTVHYFSQVSNMQSAIARLAQFGSPTANADGYFEATRWFLGKYEALTYNPAQGGVTMDFMGLTKGAENDAGGWKTDKGARYRKLTINLELIPDAQIASIMGGIRYAGTDKEIFVSLYPGEGGQLELYHQFAGKIIEAPGFTPHTYGYHRNMLVIRET